MSEAAPQGTDEQHEHDAVVPLVQHVQLQQTVRTLPARRQAAVLLTAFAVDPLSCEPLAIVDRPTETHNIARGTGQGPWHMPNVRNSTTLLT